MHISARFLGYSGLRDVTCLEKLEALTGSQKGAQVTFLLSITKFRTVMHEAAR